MSDLSHVLPDSVFDQHADLIQLLEDNLITTADLIAETAIDIARRVNAPVSAIQRLAQAVANDLHAQLASDTGTYVLRDGKNGADGSVKLLDPALDAASGDGIRTKCITEIVGPSGAGKTQFLLLALLSAQLPAPYGLGRPTLYISTEHTLPTQRLTEMLSSNPAFERAAGPGPQPSLANILTLHAPDLETQDHVLQFQLPVVLARRGVGLVVIDSIAANYRAEDIQNARTDGPNGGGKSGNHLGRQMSNRSVELVRLGGTLRELARKYDCAILVANQVADRIEPLSATSGALGGSGGWGGGRTPGSSPAAPPSSMHSSQGGFGGPPSSANSISHPAPAPAPAPPLLPHNVMDLDHQQRWFTGWGDEPPEITASNFAIAAARGFPQEDSDLKTPALGMVWTNQITCRISLHRQRGWARSTGAPKAVPPPAPTSATAAAAAAAAAVAGAGGAGAGQTGATAAATSREAAGLGGADWSKRRWRRRVRLAFAPWAEACPGSDPGTEYEIWAGGLRSIGKDGEET